MQRIRHGVVIAIAIAAPLGLLLLSPLRALGQPAEADALSAVLDCADIEREILRLECYDDAVEAIRRGAAAGPEEPSSVSPRADAAARAADRDTVPRARPDAVPAARPGAPDASRAEARGDLPRRDAQSPQAVVDVSPERGGAGEDADGERRVTIVEVRTRVPGRAVFVTSDGEQFVQTSGRLRLYLPDAPFQADLREGAVGGMFLTPEGTRRSIRIAERE